MERGLAERNSEIASLSSHFQKLEDEHSANLRDLEDERDKVCWLRERHFVFPAGGFAVFVAYGVLVTPLVQITIVLELNAEICLSRFLLNFLVFIVTSGCEIFVSSLCNVLPSLQVANFEAQVIRLSADNERLSHELSLANENLERKAESCQRAMNELLENYRCAEKARSELLNEKDTALEEVSLLK